MQTPLLLEPIPSEKSKIQLAVPSPETGPPQKATAIDNHRQDFPLLQLFIDFDLNLAWSIDRICRTG